MRTKSALEQIYSGIELSIAKWSGRVIFEGAQRIQKLYRDPSEKVNLHRFSIQFSTRESAHLAALRWNLLWLKITRSDQVFK